MGSDGGDGDGGGDGDDGGGDDTLHQAGRLTDGINITWTHLHHSTWQ